MSFDDADESFCKFFRVELPLNSAEHGALDRLSLLACQRQGVLPEELLPGHQGTASPVGSPNRRRTPTSPPRSLPRSNALDAADRKRRAAKLSILEDERRSICDVLHSAADARRLTHEHTRVQTELEQQRLEMESADGGAARSHTPDEARAIDLLVAHVRDQGPQRRVMEDAIDSTKKAGEREIEKMRNRQIGFIINDLKREVVRNTMVNAIAEREAKFEEAVQRREEVAKTEAKRKEKERRRKMTALRIRNDALFTLRKEQLEGRAAEEQAVWLATKKAKAAGVEERKAQSAAATQVSKARAEAVREHDALRFAVMDEEQTDTLQLHDERRVNLLLKLEISKEQRRIHASRKMHAAQDYVANLEDGSAAARARLDEQAVSSQQVVQRTRRARQRVFHDQAQREGEASGDAAKRREEADVAHARKSIALLQTEQRRDGQVASVRKVQAGQRAARAAMAEQREQHHADNAQRLERLQEYQQGVKDALLAEQLARDRASKQLKATMAKKMQAARQRLARDQELVAGQVQILRDAPASSLEDPQQLLDRTMATLEQSGSRSGSTTAAAKKRDAPATASSRREPSAPAKQKEEEPARPGTTPTRAVLDAGKK
jgi:hypothetical protein